MNTQRHERLRRAAILIASLEQSLGQQMLAALPADESSSVLAILERLDAIDPDEQRDVVDEFRRATRPTRAPADAVEFTYSAPPSSAFDLSGMSAAGEAQAVEPAVTTFTPEEIQTAVHLLSQEHPQTIAAALSRLSHEVGAEVFAALSGSLQEEVLDRLANMHDVDEDAAEVVETQLKRRMEQERENRARTAAAAERAQQLLERTPADRRATLLGQLQRGRLPSGDRGATDASMTMRPEVAHDRPQTRVALNRLTAPDEPGIRRETLAYSVSQAPQIHGDYQFHSLHAASDQSTPEFNDRSSDLEALSDDELTTALRAADEATVQRALAASSERFVARVASRLRRRDAKRLRQTLRSLGPMSVVELRTAQHELLALARRERALAA